MKPKPKKSDSISTRPPRTGKFFTSIGAAVSIFAGSLCAQTSFKVFMISGTTSDHSPMTAAGKPVLEKMALANHFTIDFTTDKTLINDSNLAKYDVFLQMQLYPFDLSDAQRASLQKFVEGGKGWVGVHAAGCAQSNWPWFVKFLGDVTWVTHANLRDGNLIFEDRNHPATKNMPASLIIKDEWYQFSKSPRPNVHVLAKADEHNYSPYDAQGDHPIVWCNPAYPKSIYISIGHDPNDWNVPDYVSLIHDAILWSGAATTRINAANDFQHTSWTAKALGWKGPEILLITDAEGRRLNVSIGLQDEQGSARIFPFENPGTHHYRLPAQIIYTRKP